MENFEPIIHFETAEPITFEDPDWIAIYDFEQEAMETKRVPIYDTREPGVDREELWPSGWDCVSNEPPEVFESVEGGLSEREEDDDEFLDSIDRQYSRYVRIRAEANN